jgi:hypothetical protein
MTITGDISTQKWFTGPRVQGDEAALEAIEAQLERAG